MSVLDRLNDPELGRLMVQKVKDKAARAAENRGRPVRLMEVCGTHTTAISRYGLRSLFAGLLEFRSGPGCPVCVTSAGDMEQMLALSRVPGVTVATFGDMLRVPGRKTTLEKERAAGAEVKIVYSPAGAVEAARQNPEREIVFLGIGFETTAPLVALCLQEAAGQNLKNFSVYPAHKLIPPVIKALLDQGGMDLDGFLLPGHASTVTGSRAFDFVSRDFGIPAAVCGFTPVDILDSLYTLLEKIESGSAETVNAYRRAVRDGGNQQAQKVMSNCFYPGPASWRGFGSIPESGLCIRDEFRPYDAVKKFSLPRQNLPERKDCRCGELLRGTITPPECPRFGRGCTPSRPAGPCMVSSEGACAAYYQYER